ncbi:hypothetical protein PF011_g16980 [Phytophthora fragariae]|uniref:Uncharacterized protein n=1 Tax=Phytophthora fragariae TaxID=53985 RepID=A0A6A3JG74_9STRA|nr:hypothetical protein PF011_g16980 [Phytophthora fragariae]
MPVPAAGLVCGCQCQGPTWSAAASCRLGLVLPLPVAGLVCFCRCRLPAWCRC